MIRKYKQEDKDIVSKIIKNDSLQNVYLYIDTEIYGFEGDNVETYLVLNNDIQLILYKYYNSLQIFQNSNIDNKEEIIEFIKDNNFDMISGNINIISLLNSELNDIYKMTTGYIFKKEEKISQKSDISQLAIEEDYDDIAKLICSDENIGGHYSITGLKEQLLDRMKYRNCKNLIIKKDNNIIGHAGTYADIDDIAVIGGVITNNNFRGLGYGKQIVDDLTYMIQQERKIPILYCYDNKIIPWYEKQNWNKIISCAKLEKK